MIRFAKTEVQYQDASFIKEANQRYLNFNLKSNHHLNENTETFKFSFCYDKTNSGLWYGILKPASPSSIHKTQYYYPVSAEKNDSFSPQDILKTLKQDFNDLQALPHYSPMKYFTDNMFHSDGTTHLDHLEALYRHNNHQKSPLFKMPSCALFDYVATTVNTLNSVIEGDELIRHYSSIKISNETTSLQEEINKGTCFVNNEFDFNKIKDILSGSPSNLMIDTTKIRNFFKQYLHKRIHDAALTLHWFNTVNTQCNDALASALIYKRLYQALFIINTFAIATALTMLIVTTSPTYFLALPILSIIALFLNYQIHQTITSTAAIEIEKGVAKDCLNDSKILSAEHNHILTKYFLKVSNEFKETPVNLTKATNINDSADIKIEQISANGL